jgi:hypothetical protein
VEPGLLRSAAKKPAAKKTTTVKSLLHENYDRQSLLPRTYGRQKLVAKKPTVADCCQENCRKEEVIAHM